MADGFITEAFEKFDRQWALVTAGVEGDFNTMTVSWGGLGTLWSLPVATVYVRPSRYTHDFIEREGLFTVSFYPEKYRRDLALLGSKSGRDGDKVGGTSLEPVTITTQLGQTVSFRQAELTLVCRKLYKHNMDKYAISDEVAENNYEHGEPAHTLYIGEVIRVIKS